MWKIVMGYLMMTTYFLIEYLHIIAASVLLGTGAGIAFPRLLAHRRVPGCQSSGRE
jgi:uncharacterized membrane protein